MRRRFKVLIIVICFFLGLTVYFFYRVDVKIPNVEEELAALPFTDDGDYIIYGDNWLKKNKYGLWEMYIHGNAFERGVAFGRLTQKLNAEKEKAFVTEIHHRISSAIQFNFLKYVVAWFNRDLELGIPEEFQKEIYGTSLYMSDDYDYIAPKFHRSLNYHAAHDIGHALQNLNMVGCTSFAVNSQPDSSDGDLIIGRNFDFYFGDEFAKDKIVAFVEPDSGYNFMSVTWAGFCGVVSGMNDQGLTVTLNSAKTEITFNAKTPVSIIGRHILQYASTIEEAFAIASSYDSFVSESFLIGSAKDQAVGLIEKNQEQTALFQNGLDKMIVTNHFQSDELKDSPPNLEYLQEGVSQYRYKKVEELLNQHDIVTPEIAAAILRNTKGLTGVDIGLGNEKAINQLIAHHSVIFKPGQLKAWVSTAPYQLGELLCYDLNQVFDSENTPESGQDIFVDSLSIQKDKMLVSGEYEKFLVFKQISDKIKNILYFGSYETLSADEIDSYLQSNPESYLTYFYLGDYLLEEEQYARAEEILKIGLSKVIARNSEKKHMENSLSICEENLNK